MRVFTPSARCLARPRTGDRPITSNAADPSSSKRGATWRGANDGGDQERELAAQYRHFAEETRLDWPRTSALLERIAQYYESEGQRQDEDVERRDWA
jgi:hypothetical protein